MILGPYASLGVALAAGLLVGLERGWRERELPDGGRIAGLRTFALIGLVGGLLALLPSPAVPLGVGLAAVALLFAVGYRRVAAEQGTLSITTAVAALSTFTLGALATSGQPVIAIGGAVVVAVLLDLKTVLHGWLRLVQPAEINALLQLGVLSAVVLPLLPDQGLGPYEAVNPFRLWIAVILIASISLLGHVATRWRGERSGLLWTGLLGGLASSTAATFALSRLARAGEAGPRSAAAGVLAACGMMFFRIAAVILALRPGMSWRLLVLLAGLGLLTLGAAALCWRRSDSAARPAGAAAAASAAPVFDLRTALGFGLVLAVVAVIARAASQAFGAAGLYAVAFISGLADVDAILVSAVQMSGQGIIGVPQASSALLLAVAANMLLKAVAAWAIGGAAVGRPVASGFAATTLAGAAVLLLGGLG
ncbi:MULTISPECIES: DUF4010 domain-containing protein [Ramlibacter]|uniref:MgtC/SapB family protein n=1 Tax=Ramlibacter aquaticus TaxID=2780094 RepID=A0ABR9SFK5_9BURK|nr:MULTISPECIES: DUF4010 domain-containing protein [Ramlibacter]MBE7941045.1 MgtC/SapB family protein [Ramlibacter aquaticus]